MKTVLITGSSTGFGRALVPHFLKQGWNVIATLRNLDGRKDLFSDELKEFSERLHLEELDVTSAKDISSIARLVETHFGGKLDCLVNNAGYGLFGAFEELSESEIREQMEVNFFGSVLLTHVLLPSLRRTRGRILILSSVCGYVGMPWFSVYCASKFALEGLFESLNYELSTLGVQICLIEPGGFGTEFLRHAHWGKRSSTITPYIGVIRGFRKHLRLKSQQPSQDPGAIVKKVLDLSSQSSLPLRIQIGWDAKAAYLLRNFVPQGIRNYLMREMTKRRSVLREENSPKAA